MKIVFSTKDHNEKSFVELCNFTKSYNCAGFEIFDAKSEQKYHSDSIFRNNLVNAGKRKLYNRGISISAISFPYAVERDDVTADQILSYVDFAVVSGCENVILFIENEPDIEKLTEKLALAVKKAEDNDISVLFETKNYLSNSKNILKIINHISSAALGAAWNIRETYFEAKETADETIGILGAYIKYVRLGDRKDGVNTLIGQGKLPFDEFLDALASLNYDSFVCALWNDEITDADIVITHFVNFISSVKDERKNAKKLYYNRDKSGTFPYKKYTVVDKTFPQVLDDMVECYPDQYAFKYSTLQYKRTYSEFRKDVDKVAAALISIGVKPGHHVAVWATNVPEWFLTFWAATKIGAVLVTVNTAYRINEIEYLLRQSDTHTLVMIENCKDINYGEIISELCPELKTLKAGEHLYSKKLPFLKNVITVGFDMAGCLNWNKFLLRADSIPKAEVNRRAAMVKPDDVANMQYTSGTTGFPKGVMLTHRNIINNGKIIGDRMDLSTAERMMIQVPMFHCFGMVLSMTSMMTHGGTLSPLPYFSPKSSLACINAEKITCFNGVPTMFIAMFSHEDFKKTDFSYMRTGIMAGSNCPPELMKKAAKEMNMREILSVYGQTEASPGCTMGEVNEDLEHRTETVGSAFPLIECKIIDPETGEDLPNGQSGEFVVRGFNVMKGYYKMPAATKQAIDKEGWLHSGDLCMKTEDGYYKVTGRLKDMIIRGGENIYPREIEEFYLTHEKIRDVQVVGVKDERYGEEACAFIILKENETSTEAEMREFGMKHIAGHKVPRYFVFTDSFPMNAAGKILKYKMKEDFEKNL
ncbi:MAG: AMP-binding protein [Clostridia bacterium]|nr:AMP-binding protein [Clostridia bacterium]